MSSMNEIIALVSALVVGFLVLYFGKKHSQKKPDGPPKNRTASAAGEVIQESFKDEVDRIRSATTGDSPADDLATMGNARRRR
jgi:hypothetical protein